MSERWAAQGRGWGAGIPARGGGRGALVLPGDLRSWAAGARGGEAVGSPLGQWGRVGLRPSLGRVRGAPSRQRQGQGPGVGEYVNAGEKRAGIDWGLNISEWGMARRPEGGSRHLGQQSLWGLETRTEGLKFGTWRLRAKRLDIWG